MSRLFQLLLQKTWKKEKGARSMFLWLLIVSLALAYATLFPFLVEAFGTTARMFPALYLAIGAVSWGLRGAFGIAILNIAFNIGLHRYYGMSYEGGVVGPLGCLFATCLVGMISDMARELDKQLKWRKRAEAERKEGEEKYKRLFNMESDAILFVDNESGKIRDANDSAVSLYGFARDELLQMNNIDISAEPDGTRLATKEKWRHIPLRYHRKKDGSVFPVEISARHYTWKGREVHVAAIRDISDRLAAEEEKRRLEKQFYQAQKMESVGTLAGGIAHDFNNLLGGIMGNAELAILRIKDNKDIMDHLQNINRITKSGAKLTRQLLGYARGGKYQVKPTSLNDLIAEQNQLFGRTNKQITIKEAFEKNLWTTDVDRGQIEQVLLNIYVNAQHAMPNGGFLTVETDNVLVDEAHGFPFVIRTGRYIKITITDTGAGMGEEVLRRVYDPFFTTKEIGRGTGLGMASVYGIVKNHDGYIHIDSEPGKGTTVILFFPCSGKPSLIDAKGSAGRIAKGTGTILFVDDEAAVLEVTRQMVELMGYEVLTASSGEEAVEVYKDHRHHIDLVLLDIIMPDMGGEETFARLKEIDPALKVLVATGYSLDQKADELRELGCKGFIQKPFQMSALSVKIKELIRAAA